MTKTKLWAALASCALIGAGYFGVRYARRERVDLPVLPDVQGMQMQPVQPVSPQEAPSGQSGLDLLRNPDGAAAPEGPDQQQQIAQAMASGDAMSQSVVAMLDSLAPMLNNPMITSNMKPQQKADFAQLKKMIADLKSGIASGKPITPQEQQKNMLKIQQLTVRMMGAGLPKAAPPGKSP
jgi:hypothetical protein